MRFRTRELFLAGALTVSTVGLAVPASAASPVADLRTDAATPPGKPELFLANIDDDAGVCKARSKELLVDAAGREQADNESFRVQEAALREEAKDPAKKEAAERKYAALRRTHRLAQYQADRDMAGCNDAADTVVNGAQDEADLARLHTAPWAAAPASATGRVTVPGAGADHVRLFVKRPKSAAPRGWEVVGPDTKLSAAELRAGVELGIEGRDIVRDSAVWAGRVTVRLDVTANGVTSSRTVALEQAPVLTQLNTQRLQEALASDDQDPETGKPFTDALAAAVKANGVATPLRRVDTGGDQWMQDLFEPGYASIPGPGGKPHGMRVLIPSVNENRHAASRVVFTELAGPDVAAVHIAHVPTPDEDSTYDSMGNLETVPAYPGYPAGRIVIGGDPADGKKGPAAEMLTFLRSQNMQKPLSLDTSWLSVGHIDEFVQFLPAPGSRLGWRAVVADPRSGMRILQDAKKAGYGGQIMHGGLPALDWRYTDHVDQRSISEFLADPQFLHVNDRSAKRIDANVAVLKREVGLTDADIVRVPALFTARTMDYLMLQSEIRSMKPGPDRDAAEARLRAMDQAVALIPGTVNGLVLNNGEYVAPKPFGPLIGGKDVFTEAIDKAFATTGYTVRYVDDLLSTHVSEGEIHCATNTLRAVFSTDQRWWPHSA
ncbi:hypothetical protein C8250_002395 [Streptomyces sp. So13.3]|uniref:protein-arginine deiminase family protein n=1 Tax=Streptomyces TaxID=1883 RepID=UPI0011064C0D|nr:MULTISPECIES: protein-arginine deiminase family protein [Streptomyces]QNA70932.1 hypothetical protein C8250_002395 [Streptomyces sp. So13.3]